MKSPHARILAALVLLALSSFAGCGGKDNPTKPPGGGADLTINITGNLGGNSYSPSLDSVNVGQTVRWHNGDSMAHTATGNSGEFDTGSISPGANSSAITMTSAATIAYHCEIHPSMVATLKVK